MYTVNVTSYESRILSQPQRNMRRPAGQRVQRAQLAGTYWGLLRPKVKSKQDFLGRMMIVQTFMEGKKKEGEE